MSRARRIDDPGRVVIPNDIRYEMCWRENTALIFEIRDDVVIMSEANPEQEETSPAHKE